MTFTCILTGCGGGGGDGTTQPPPVGTIALALSLASGSATQGGQVTIDVTVTRTNYSGGVTLAAENLPTGVTFAVGNLTTNGNTITGTITLTVGASAAAGGSSLTIRATGSGVAAATATFGLTITVSVAVTLNFNDCTSPVIWVAYQDGNAAWTHVTSVNNIYTFTIGSATAGYAYVMGNVPGANRSIIVQYKTKGELSAAPIIVCQFATVGNKFATGIATGFTSGFQVVSVSLGGASATATSAAPNFTLQGVLNGTHDLVAYRKDLTPSTSDRYIIHRDQDLPNGSSVGTLNFAGSEGTAPVPGTITVTGSQSGDSFLETMYYVTGTPCQVGRLYAWAPPAAVHTAVGIAPASQRSSDFHALQITANGSDGSERYVTEVFHAMGNRTIALGTKIATPMVTTLTGNYKRQQVVFGLTAEYNRLVDFYYQQIQPSGNRGALIEASPAALGSGTVTLALPNFTGVAGWDDAWGPLVGVSASWSVDAVGDNSTGIFCAEGFRRIETLANGTN